MFSSTAGCMKRKVVIDEMEATHTALLLLNGLVSDHRRPILRPLAPESSVETFRDMLPLSTS